MSSSDSSASSDDEKRAPKDVFESSEEGLSGSGSGSDGDNDSGSEDAAKTSLFDAFGDGSDSDSDSVPETALERKSRKLLEREEQEAADAREDVAVSRGMGRPSVQWGHCLLHLSLSLSVACLCVAPSVCCQRIREVCAAASG